MSMNVSNDGFGVMGVIVGVCGLAYAWYQNREMKKNQERLNATAKKLDLSLDDVANKMTVDIQQSVVDKATERAIERAVLEKANSCASQIRNDMYTSIERKVKDEVASSLNTIKEKVSKEVTKQVDYIDKDTMLNTVIDKVSEDLKIEGKKELSHKLNGIVNDLSDNLASYKKVFDGVTSVLTPRIPDNNNGREYTIRLN